MDYKKIGEFIQKRRKELGLTQKQLGEKLNVTDKAVSKWETGQGCPDISLLGELSESLEVGIGEILNGEYNETLKDNSEFIMNAVDYSKKVTEDNIYEKIRKILYIVLILITFYMTFMGIRQFIYLSSGIKFKSSSYDSTYQEYEKLKENVQIVKENGYLVYNDKNFTTDFSGSLEHLLLKLEATNLFSKEDIIIKNTELLNIEMLISDIITYDNMVIIQLKSSDKDNSKYYNLLLLERWPYIINGWLVDESGNIEGSENFDYDSITRYYSSSLYEYNSVINNSSTLNNLYNNIGIELKRLNKFLELVIEVGEKNENN